MGMLAIAGIAAIPSASRAAASTKSVFFIGILLFGIGEQVKNAAGADGARANRASVLFPRNVTGESL